MLRIIFLSLLLYGNMSYAQDYQFYGKMSRPQLESYLSRALVTEFDNLNRGIIGYYDLINFSAKANARMMITCYGVGYSSELHLNHGYFDSIANTVQDINAAYTQLGHLPPIIGVAIWEAITSDVDSIWMDSAVYNMYHIPIRRFIFDSMKYVNAPSTSIATPDISRLETQMYFYYLAHRLIDCGIEDLQMGIIGIENLNDTGNIMTWDLYSKIRQYAATRNRGLVLINAGTNGLRLKQTDTLIFDYCTSPSRVSGYYTGPDSTWSSMWDYFESSFGGPGRLSYNDCSPYGKVIGGQTYMGWYADSMPYQVDLDNYLTDLCNCLTSSGCWNAYGFDEISWFALQTEDYRNQWLCYANSRVKELDRNCYFAMPVRTLFTRIWKYYNAMNGYGYNQEDVILNILNGTLSDCNPNDVTDLKAIWGKNNSGITLVVYPNPATDIANISYSALKKNTTVNIRIIDVLGNSVMQWNTNNNQGYKTWNTRYVKAGIYTCIASAEDEPSVIFKIVVVK